MIQLSVNLNRVALLRNSRDIGLPDLLKFARICIAAGTNGLTVHPRPDQRHIRPQDVRDLSQLIKDEAPAVEFNIEGNPTPEFLDLVLSVVPDQCTLVPDTPEQLTSDHGWNLQQNAERATEAVEQLKSAGIRVSLFMDTDKEQIQLASATGAHRIELYTGPYAVAFGTPQQDAVYQAYQDAATLAANIGLELNAGHDLNLDNLPHFAATPGLKEVSIGHALIADALEMGMERAVRAYCDVLSRQA